MLEQPLSAKVVSVLSLTLQVTPNSSIPDGSTKLSGVWDSGTLAQLQSDAEALKKGPVIDDD